MTKDGTGDILWRTQELNAIFDAMPLSDACAVRGVSIDSRTVETDDLFVAIKGDRFDGHDFVEAAFKQGAAAALIGAEQVNRFSHFQSRLIIADDPLRGMQTLARAARARSMAKIVAITGSVGKTGTKEALSLAFSADGPTHASVKSFNNHWGVPLTLSRLSRDSRYGIFEIGMNHAGEITPLVEMVRPHLAIITTVGPVHIEFFENEAGIARAKAEIFSGVESGGLALLNSDNHHFTLLSEIARELGVQVVKFGEAMDADIRLVGYEADDQGSLVEAEVFGSPVSYRLGAPGRHIVQNSLSVAGALYLMKADLDAGLGALADLPAPKGRGARQTVSASFGEFKLLDESYNANPASMAAALANLGDTKPESGGRRIAVLGDMLELGEGSLGFHAGLREPLDKARADLAFLSGPDMRALWDTLPDEMRGGYAETSEELQKIVVDTVARGDVVMVKGSLGSRMGPIVDALLSLGTAGP